MLGNLWQEWDSVTGHFPHQLYCKLVLYLLVKRKTRFPVTEIFRQKNLLVLAFFLVKLAFNIKFNPFTLPRMCSEIFSADCFIWQLIPG